MNKNIILYENDYRIINYSETIYNNKEIRKILEIEIINIQKIDLLNDILDPSILLHFNKKEYNIRGQLYYQSHRPINLSRDYYWFFIDNDKKIYDFQNNIIKFIGFEIL
ncbi:MAG: hypothetical protein FWD28_10795 [Treponema sp.]|nr:hypothetical protein [Treponema sp.]